MLEKDIFKIKENTERLEVRVTELEQNQGPTECPSTPTVTDHEQRLSALEKELNGVRSDLINNNNSIVNKLV